MRPAEQLFKSIVGDQLGSDSLIDPSWYNTWFPYTSQPNYVTSPDGSITVRAGDVRVRTPNINVQFDENRKASYIDGLSQIVEKGNNAAKPLSKTQQAEFDAAKAALGDVLSDPAVTDSDNERMKTAVLGANSALDDGDVPELPEGGIFGNPPHRPGLGRQNSKISTSVLSSL